MKNIMSFNESINDSYLTSDKVLRVLNYKYPTKKPREVLETIFKYKPHVIDCILLSEEEFAQVQPEKYAMIQEWEKKNAREDNRTKFEMCQNICANFIMEDLMLLTFNRYNGNLTLNGDRERERDIYEYPSNKPDFTYKSFKHPGKNLQVEMKVDWGRYMPDECFLRNNGFKEIASIHNGVVLFIHENKFTLIDFTKPVQSRPGQKFDKDGYFSKPNNQWHEFDFGPNAAPSQFQILLKELDKIFERV